MKQEVFCVANTSATASSAITSLALACVTEQTHNTRMSWVCSVMQATLASTTAISPPEQNQK